MARARNPKRDEAMQIYLDALGQIKMKDIAARIETTDSRVRKWKAEDKWDEILKERSDSAKGALLLNGRGETERRKREKSITKKVVASVEENLELTEKQRLFCVYYANSNNATQAYLKAYDCTYTTAMQEGYANLRKPQIQNEISRLKKIMRMEVDFDVLDLIHYCLRVVGADIGDYLTFGQHDVQVIGPEGPVEDENGAPMTVKTNYVLIGESNKLDTSLISEIKQSKDGISIKLADKKWAWEQLIKYFDLLPDKEKREIDRARLELERDKVQIMRDKAKTGEEDEGADEAESYKTALMGKVDKVWADD